MTHLRTHCGLLLALCGLVFAPHSQADFEVSGPDGRRILLKDNGTWAYVPSKEKESTQDVAGAETKGPLAILRLEQRIERGNHCRLVLSLTNQLPYEIRNIVPYFTIYRANGALHETLSAGFHSIRSGDRKERSIDLTRIACPEVARVQVTGGDRCDMAELHKFSPADGQCLARIGVAPSDWTRFEK